MRLLETILTDWQRLTCSHQWVRARWPDGSYGMRCSNCMKPYRHTWNEIIARVPKASSSVTRPAVAMAPITMLESAPPPIEAPLPALESAA